MNAITKLFSTPDFTRTLMDSLPGGLLLLDGEGRVQVINNIKEKLFGVREKAVIGKGPGNSLGCLNAFENPKGCGSTEDCLYCDIRKIGQTALSSTQKQKTLVSCQLVIDGQVRAVALLVHAVPFILSNKQRYVFLIIEDISGLKTLLPTDETEGFRGIVGRDNKMIELFDTIKKVAQINAPVLIRGETGTGKELIALAIHKESSRARKLFVPVNCAALPEGLFESDIFGHVKGAFTGAMRDKKGRFELAHGGTLFLDEIGELNPAIQGKLLRVLQEGCFERVGNPNMIKVDVRVIAATNSDLEKRISDGQFRADLFYRLNVLPITVPPLRERIEDIPILVKYFVKKCSEKYGIKIDGIPQKSMNILKAHPWPGNARELENLVERVLILLPDAIFKPEILSNFFGNQDTHKERSSLLHDLERDHITSVLKDCLWVIEGIHGAALRLGLNPGTLRSRMKKLGIKRPQ